MRSSCRSPNDGVDLTSKFRVVVIVLLFSSYKLVGMRDVLSAVVIVALIGVMLSATIAEGRCRFEGTDRIAADSVYNSLAKERALTTAREREKQHRLSSNSYSAHSFLEDFRLSGTNRCGLPQVESHCKVWCDLKAKRDRHFDGDLVIEGVPGRYRAEFCAPKQRAQTCSAMGKCHCAVLRFESGAREEL